MSHNCIFFTNNQYSCRMFLIKTSLLIGNIFLPNKVKINYMQECMNIDLKIMIKRTA